MASDNQPSIPPVDVFEDENGLTVLADLPGVTRDQLHVRVDGDTLAIEGTASVNGADNMQLVYSEALIPAFQRKFTLSRELDPGRIEANLKDGVLRLLIPKSEAAKPRRIEVKTS